MARRDPQTIQPQSNPQADKAGGKSTLFSKSNSKSKTITGKTRAGAQNASVYAVKVNGKKATGAPTEYDAKHHPEAAYKLCAELGAENTQLAVAFNIGESTIGKWQREHPEFVAAIKRGKADWDDQNVVSALRKRALGYGYTETSTKTVRIKQKTTNKNGDKVGVILPAAEVTIVEKQLAPDVTACIFWLVNRQPDDWKHVARTIVQGDSKNPVRHEYSIDLKQIPDKDLEKLEDTIAKARRDKADAASTSDGPSGTA